MTKLGTIVAVVVIGSVTVAEAKTTKVVAAKTAKQAKDKPVAKAAKAKADDMERLPLVGQSPFGKLAPVRVVRRSKKRSARARLRAMRRRARFAAPRLGTRATAAMPTEDQTVLRMAAQTLRSKDINKVIRANFSSIQACYERSVALNRAPKGVVSVHFVIAPSGKVATASVTCGKANRALKLCIERRIRGWSFPQADAPTTVDYPFVFDVAESR